MGRYASPRGLNSEARQKARKFGKLANILEAKASEMTTQVDTVADELTGAHNTFLSNPDAGEGLLNDTFELHEGMWENDYTLIVSNMRMGISDLKSKATSARQLETYWNQVADMEEVRASAGF